jgi:tRNA A-37 threonylcarbamoyl transferase component Bud32
MSCVATNVSLAAVKHLFAEVCDLPSVQRVQRLNALTEDPALVKNVLALLDANDTHTSRATRIAGSAVELLGSVTRSEMTVGDRLGAWSLSSVLGEGGMGSVFLAERVDGHFNQQVAIKVLHGIPSAFARENLARERQILANLAHPYIAKLFDGGSTPKGRPYLVMAYVRGTGIDEYCRAQRLSTTDVLRLYLRVCEPVAFAHQHLVVHCDLKPSNVLIDSSGRPALLDFGIARLIDTGNPSGEVKAFTLRYASPEQQKGETVSTTTDIYSLGVMLRELIAEPNREVNAIIDKATACESKDRYATVDAFAADIRRYLDGKLVNAMPTTLSYRTRKFVVNRWPYLTVATLFLATVAGFAMQLIAARDLSETARLEAQRQRDIAQSAQMEAVRQRDRAQNAELDALNDRNRAQESARLATSERNRAQATETMLRQVKTLALTAQQDVANSVTETKLQAEQSAASIKLVQLLLTSARPNESGHVEPGALAMLEAGRKRIESDESQHPAARASLMFAIAQSFDLMGETRTAHQIYRATEALELSLSPRRTARLAEVVRRLNCGTTSEEHRSDAANCWRSDPIPAPRHVAEPR